MCVCVCAIERERDKIGKRIGKRIGDRIGNSGNDKDGNDNDNCKCTKTRHNKNAKRCFKSMNAFFFIYFYLFYVFLSCKKRLGNGDMNDEIWIQNSVFFCFLFFP